MQNIIFDFDGTLCDSFESVLKIAQELTKHPSLLDPQQVEGFKGYNLVQLALHLGIPRYKFPILLYQGRRKMTRDMVSLKPFPDTEATLKAIQNLSKDIYLMTSNSQQNIEIFLNHYHLAGYFKAIYPEVSLFGKAQALKKLSKQYHFDISSAVYIGDEVRDIEAAKAAGMRYIAVTWGYNNKEVLSRVASGEENIVSNHQELLKLID